jgi:transcriptional regulator GlxA family with amidase domain
MKDPKDRRYGQADAGAAPATKTDMSRWSVSAVVMLGDAGLPVDRETAAHRQSAHLLDEHLAEAGFDGDRVFVRDGAQVNGTAIDLGLLLADEDLGPDMAHNVARRLVVFLKRPGDQSQLSVHLVAQPAGHGRTHNVQQYILSHPAADLSVGALAKIAAMSDRNFTRVFKQEVGLSPSDYVDQARVDVARFLLEGSRLSIEAIAARSGFGSSRAMRRAFLSRVGSTPSDYRERFRASGTASGSGLSGNGCR